MYTKPALMSRTICPDIDFLYDKNDTLPDIYFKFQNQKEFFEMSDRNRRVYRKAKLRQCWRIAGIFCEVRAENRRSKLFIPMVRRPCLALSIF